MDHAWKRNPRVWTAIVVMLLFWASAFAGIRAGLVAYGPGEVALLRFGTASLVLALYALATRMRMPAAKDWPVIALSGFIGISLYHVALNFGEMTVASGAAALIIASAPIFTAVFSSRILGERITPLGWFGMAVAFGGVALIAFGEGKGGLHFNAHSLLILVSAIATSVYAIMSKPLLTRYSGLELTSYAIWAGTVPLLFFLPGLIGQAPHATLPATLSVVYLGIFPGALSYVLWSYALARMPASTLSAFLYVQPVNAAVIAWIWLHEVPAALTVMGGVLAITGVVVMNARGLGAPGSAPATHGYSGTSDDTGKGELGSGS